MLFEEITTNIALATKLNNVFLKVNKCNMLSNKCILAINLNPNDKFSQKKSHGGDIPLHTDYKYLLLWLILH